MSTLTHRPRKRFGQNFLVDQHIVNAIVSAIAPRPGDNLVEIGPGQGALTELLLASCPTLKMIELDRDLVAALRKKFAAYTDCQIFQNDALKFDFSTLLTATQPLRIVGNLPYNISTPLIFHLLNYADNIADMHFMLQKEVVDRLAATPGSKHYGRLSIAVQYRCAVHPLVAVPPHAFSPAPKVDSAFVRLTPHRPLPIAANDPELLHRLVNICFQQRRKTLRNSLKLLIDAELTETLDVDLRARPETLSVAEFVKLSNQLSCLL